MGSTDHPWLPIGRRERQEEAGRLVLSFPPEVYGRVQASLQSYLGLFGHASTFRLCAAMFCARSPWLGLLFARRGGRIVKRWELRTRPARLKVQYGFFRRRFQGAVLFHVGRHFERFDRDAVRAAWQLGMKRIPARPGFYARCGTDRVRCLELARRLAEAWNPVLVVVQDGRRHGTSMRRAGVGLVITECRTPGP